jgi:two-component system chemotaxis response regulator CheY
MDNKKILFVEDSPTISRIIHDLLSKIGYKKIVHAENGIDALKKIKNNDFDLIITDWNMPGMDGIELVSNLRSSDAYKSIPIIMASTNKTESDIKKAFDSGINDYIIKPFSNQKLAEKILYQINEQK